METKQMTADELIQLGKQRKKFEQEEKQRIRQIKATKEQLERQKATAKAKRQKRRYGDDIDKLLGFLREIIYNPEYNMNTPFPEHYVVGNDKFRQLVKDYQINKILKLKEKKQ